MLISKSRLATYAKHAKVTHAINDITSCHDYKVVNTIQLSHINNNVVPTFMFDAQRTRLHPNLRVSCRFESIVTLQGK
jgi:hypothetical protein